MKTLGRILAGLVVLVLIAGVIAVFSADYLAGRAIEHGGTEALGVPTRVRDTDVGIVRDRSYVHGVRIANPEDFESDRLLQMDRAEVHVDLLDLLHDRVRIERLELRDLEVRIERRGKRTNYGVVFDHLRRYREAKRAADAKRFVIDRIRVRDITAHVNLLGEAGKLTEVTVAVPDLTVRGVGTGRQGAVVGQVTDQIVSAIVRAALDETRGQLPDVVPRDRVDDLIRIFRERLRRREGQGPDESESLVD